ncbi:hypothetical protein J6590_081865 [Homalodisca vitripennis]|nr:hypothetical protein J6590_081865 [Homalodisca vitripennis]
MEGTVTIIYLDMLQNFLIPQIDEDEHDAPFYYQQDGAPPHYLTVYVPPLPASLADLRRRITAAVAEVTPDLLERVWREIDYRWDVCRITNGSHIEPK